MDDPRAHGPGLPTKRDLVEQPVAGRALHRALPPLRVAPRLAPGSKLTFPRSRIGDTVLRVKAGESVKHVTTMEGDDGVKEN